MSWCCVTLFFKGQALSKEPPWTKPERARVVTESMCPSRQAGNWLVCFIALLFSQRALQHVSHLPVRRQIADMLPTCPSAVCLKRRMFSLTHGLKHPKPAWFTIFFHTCGLQEPGFEPLNISNVDNPFKFGQKLNFVTWIAIVNLPGICLCWSAHFCRISEPRLTKV